MSRTTDYIDGLLPLYDGNVTYIPTPKQAQVKKTNKCVDCGMPITKKSKRCAKCSAVRLAKIGARIKAERCVERDEAICKELDNGTSTATVVKKYKLSVSRVRAIYKKYQEGKV